MTRKEAITYLKVIWNRYKNEYEIERETLDAYHIAIEALSADAPSGDLISRQATIDKFNQFIEKCKEEHTGRVVFTIDDAKYAFIKAVESVEPVPCDSCIWEVCNYNKVDWDALPSSGGFVTR